MRELVSYSCSSCGGALTVDKKQEVYECPFCGKAYDFVQMHHNELLMDAAANMRQMEFASAKEKFNTILKSEPDDFEALRGIVLCEGNLMSVDSLRKIGKAKESSFKPMSESLKNARECAKEKEKPYFEKFSELIDLAQQYQQAEEERIKLGIESGEQFKTIVQMDVEREEDKQTAKDAAAVIGEIISSPIDEGFMDYESKLTVGMMALVLLGFAIIGFLAYALRLWSIPVIILLAASIIGGLLLNRRAYEHREASVRTNMKGSQKQTHEVLLRISKIEQQYSETYHAMVKLEPITKKAKAVTYTPKQN